MEMETFNSNHGRGGSFSSNDTRTQSLLGHQNNSDALRPQRRSTDRLSNVSSLSSLASAARRVVPNRARYAAGDEQSGNLWNDAALDANKARATAITAAEGHDVREERSKG